VSSRSALVLAVVAWLVAAPAAGAERLGWNEQAKYAGKPVMSYRVVSLTFGKSGWNARVSFRNLSEKTIRVGNEFGVGFWTSSKATSMQEVAGIASATTFSSKVPVVLKPGQSWTGVIGGHGRLHAGGRVYARVIFGPFTGFPGQRSAVWWITDHAQPLGSGPPPTTAVPGPVI
jgi:hypothetical protein